MNFERNKRRRKHFENIKYPNPDRKKNHWDKLSIILTSSLGIVLIFTYLSTSGLIPIDRLFSPENDPGFKTTSASVFSFESKEMYNQTKFGNVNSTIAYIVKYRFKVNGIYYNDEEQISSIAFPKFRLHLQQHLNEEAFYVCYEIANPQNSFLLKDAK